NGIYGTATATAAQHRTCQRIGRKYTACTPSVSHRLMTSGSSICESSKSAGALPFAAEATRDSALARICVLVRGTFSNSAVPLAFQTKYSEIPKVRLSSDPMYSKLRSADSSTDSKVEVSK